jgi:6-phosphofructokinase 1
VPDYVPDGARIVGNIEVIEGEVPEIGPLIEKAGPRERIFFDPQKTRAGVVTCGGLCPGINNVVRSIVLQLWFKYGVRSITGFKNGFEGLDPDADALSMPLDPDVVRGIHTLGGTILGTSRGGHDAARMVDRLLADRVDVLFAIGGDGTMRGLHALGEEAERRGAKLALVGIPKTIDNDIPFVDKTFGFETAVEVARSAIAAAHTEAVSTKRGLGLVKLMGRDSGFIAAYASIASRDVNACLVPEVRFALEGEYGLLPWLERRMSGRGHAVVVVAEGCAETLGLAGGERDASGNARYASDELDAGKFLKRRIEAHFRAAGQPLTLKYIDPSYMIRGVAANANDAVFCDELARHAVHAAMAGKTDVLVGRWHRTFTHVPLSEVLGKKKRIDPDRDLWLAVTESTGQPRFSPPSERRSQRPFPVA